MLDSLPNLHPFFVHFPIALFLSAVLADAALLFYSRSPWLERSVTLAYVSGAAASLVAAISGKLAEPPADSVAAATVEAVGAHGDWAFFSVVLCFAVAFARFDTFWRDRKAAAIRFDRRRGAILALALVAAGGLLRTAAHGGALVFQHGVGVSKEDSLAAGEEEAK